MYRAVTVANEVAKRYSQIEKLEIRENTLEIFFNSILLRLFHKS